MNLSRPYIFYCFTILFISFEINAQHISGQVLDFQTKEPLPYANIYFNASMRGISTDLNGEFKLNTSGFHGQDIVVSIIGYESWIIKDFQNNKYYIVYLRPSSYLLREIVIIHNDMPRKKKEKIFKREFLSTSHFAASRTIENISDVVLTYFKDTKTLEAYCFKPILIHNKALGYKIKYFLDEFKLTDNNMLYRGNFLFEEDTTLSSFERMKAVNNRHKAYTGSRMDFFREMWEDKPFGLDFYVFTGYTDIPIPKDILISEEDENIKFLNPVQKNMIISYGQEISNIEVVADNKIPFTKNGFFDSQYLLWSGEMAKERIGDLLPFEYWPFLTR